MMSSNKYKTKKVTEIDQTKAGELRGAPIVWTRIIVKDFNKIKGMRRPGKIEDMKKSIHVRARMLLPHGVGLSD